MCILNLIDLFFDAVTLHDLPTMPCNVIKRAAIPRIDMVGWNWGPSYLKLVRAFSVIFTRKKLVIQNLADAYCTTHELLRFELFVRRAPGALGT